MTISPKNTGCLVSESENKDEKGTLRPCYSSLNLSGEHLLMPEGELDPADEDAWDSVHPLSSRRTPCFRRAAPRPWHLEMWRKVELPQHCVIPRPLTNRSFSSGFTGKIHAKEKILKGRKQTPQPSL